MADQATTLAELNGFAKTKFGPKVIEHTYGLAKFSGRLPFGGAELLGDKYVVPVELTLPQGQTYASAGAGAFDLEDAIPGEMKQAQVDGNQFMFVDMLDIESAAKAKKQGEEAYGSAVARVMKRITKSATKRIELSMLYGTSNLGIVSANDYAAGTTCNLTISLASFAAGVWRNMKGALLDVYALTAVGATTGARINTNQGVKITSVDIKNRKLGVSGAAADLAAIAANHGLVFRNSRSSADGTVSKEMTGLDLIAQNTGTLYAIPGATYESFQGNVYDAGGAELTLKKLNIGLCDPIAKGLDEDVDVFINPKTWMSLMTTEAALRRYTDGGGKATNGFNEIEFDGLSGKMRFVPYTCIKESEAFVAPMSVFKKVGATDLTFQAPGRDQDEFFKLLEKKAGYELRQYANLGLFCEAPGWCLKIKNIVNAT